MKRLELRRHVRLVDEQRFVRLGNFGGLNVADRWYRRVACSVKFVERINIRENRPWSKWRVCTCDILLPLNHAYLAFLCSGKKNSCSNRSTCRRPSRLS